MEQIKSLFYRPSAAAVVALLSVTVFYIFAGVEFGKLMGLPVGSTMRRGLELWRFLCVLLMVAGEIDISIGAMIPAGAMTTASFQGTSNCR